MMESPPSAPLPPSLPRSPSHQPEDNEDYGDEDAGNTLSASPSIRFPSVPPPEISNPSSLHDLSYDHHPARTPFDYEYLFLSQQASFDLKDLMSHRATDVEWQGHWITPPASRKPLPDGRRTSPTPTRLRSDSLWLPSQREGEEGSYSDDDDGGGGGGNNNGDAEDKRVIQLVDKQMYSRAKTATSPSPQDLNLDRYGNWPFAHQRRLEAEKAQTWKLQEFKRIQRDNDMRRQHEEAMLEERRRALYHKLFMEWLGSRDFLQEYDRFLLSVPRRLTKKELLKLRETVYKVTVKKLLHGFGFIRRAFKVPTTEEGHDLDCLRDITSYFMYFLPASDVLRTLVSPEVRLSLIEVELLFELKLGLDHSLVCEMVSNYEKVQAEMEENEVNKSHSSSSKNNISTSKDASADVFLAYDPAIRFDEFCVGVLPALGEVKSMLRKEEREKLQREFNQKEREKKMGVVWERIKRRRMEMKLDLELAFMEIHPPMQSFDVRVMSVLQKVVTTGSKWWDTKQRRKFEQALKSRCVLIDIKHTLTKCVLEGVNLGGLRAKDLARVIQNMCCLRIQTAFRCYSRYRKYMGAMTMYYTRIEKLRRDVFLAFKEVLVISHNIKKYCRRIVYVWRRWAIKRRKIQEYFQLTHWPFHIWWRYTIQKLHAKDKSRFLAAVWKTYLKLRVFRGIQRFSYRLIHGKAEARSFRLRWSSGLLKEVLRCWHLYCRERHRLRINWEASGQYMADAIRHRTLITFFTVWRYASHARHLTHERGPQFFRSGYMDLEKYRYDCAKKAKAETKGKKHEKHKKHHKEKKLDYLSEPYVLFMPQTAWETDRPANPGKRPHLMPLFPLLEETTYYQQQQQVEPAMDPELREVCQPLHQFYCIRDRQQVAICYMRYRRCGPKAFNLLRQNVDRSKKRRYAVVHASLTLEARVFKAWRRFPAIKRHDDRVAREERARQEEEALKRSLDPFNHLSPMEKDAVIRKQEEAKAADLAQRVSGLAVEEQVEVEDNMEVIEGKQMKRRVAQRLAQDTMEKEKTQAVEADRKAVDWAINFKRNAVESLIYALIRMQASIKHHEEHDQVKAAWRILRLRYIEGKVQHMYNYFHLRRRLQICVRYRKLMSAMPLYYRLKTKWLTWHRWLQYLSLLYNTRTHGISKTFKQRRPRLLLFSDYLSKENLIRIHYDHTFLNPIILTKPAIFYRWVLYTHKQVAYRRMTELARRLHNIRLLRRILCVWSTGMNTVNSYRSFRRRENTTPFIEKRVMADMGVLRAWVFSTCRRSLDHAILVRNKKWKWSLRQSVLNAPSFKASINDYEEKLKARFLVERSLLFEAFRLRGELEFKDSIVPIMVGNRNKEKEDFGTLYSTQPLPGAYLIQSVEVYYKKSRGITGIILVVIPGEFSGRQERLPVVGHTHDGIPDVFTLRPHEKIVKVEVSAGIVLEQIRFITDSGRCSRWLAKPINHALATKMTLAGRGDHETLIGFYGMADSIRIITIGMKVREVTKETLFSYNWVENKAVPVTIKKVDIYIKGDDDEPDPDTPPAPVPGLDSPEQEVVLLVAMRNADLIKAMTRASNFAKMLWDNKGIPDELALLCRPNIALALSRWFFESLAKGLVAMPHNEDTLKKMVLRAQSLQIEGASLPEKVQDLHKLANRLREAHRPWNTRGVVTPSERAKEMEYITSIGEIEAEADRLEIEAGEMVHQGNKLLAEARALCPALSCSKRTRAYYRNLLTIIKAQNQLHKTFSGDNFKQFLYFGVQGDGKAGSKT